MHIISCSSRPPFQRRKSTNRKFLQKYFKTYASSTLLLLPPHASLLTAPSMPHKQSLFKHKPICICLQWESRKTCSWRVQLARIAGWQEIVKVYFFSNTEKHLYSAEFLIVRCFLSLTALLEEMNYKTTCKEHYASPATTCCEIKKHRRKKSIFFIMKWLKKGEFGFKL